jgi:hypothetical protein
MILRELGLICSAALLFAGCVSAADVNIPLTVTNRSDLARDRELASGGVPLPMGTLNDTSTLRVVNAAGKHVPAQFTVLNRWPADGSIRWVLVQFPVSIAGNQTLPFTLKRGRYRVRKTTHRVTITDRGDHVQVDTGVLRFLVKKKSFGLFDKVTLLDGRKEVPLTGPGACGNGFVIETESRGTFRTGNDPDATLRIEDAGPLRATLVAEGKHRNDQGEALFDYQVRIYAVAGSRAVRVQYVFTNSEGDWPKERIDLRRVGVTLLLKAEGAYARWLIDPKRHVDVTRPHAAARLDAAETRHYEGPAVAGLAFKNGNGIEAAVRWFWQLRPKSMEVTPDALAVRLIDAPKPKEAVHFYPGMSKTHDLLFRFLGPGESNDDVNTCRHFQDPLFVKCEPGWYCQETLSLGRLASADYEGYKPEFRNVRKLIDDGFRRQIEVIRDLRKQVVDRKRDIDSYHVIHFGDGFHHFYGSNHRQIQWDNCYYSYTHLLAMQYCRTGDDLILDTLGEAATFEGDLAVCWHKSQLGAPRVNPGAYHIGGFSGWRRFTSGTYNFYKPIGMLELFYLTGDRRHQEAGLTNLRWMLTHDGYNMLHNPRSCGAGCRAAVHGYLATGNKDYLYLARRMARYAIGMQKTYGHFAPVRNSIFMAPNALEGLCVYHELTGDPRLGKVLPEMVKADYKAFRRGPKSLTCGFMNFYIAHLADDKAHLQEMSRGMAGRTGFGIRRGEHAVKDFAAGKRPVPLMMWYLTDLAKKPTPWAGDIELDASPDDTVRCPRLSPKLDGTLGREEWAKAAALTLVGLPNPKRELTAATRVRVAHDLKNLYLAVEAAEPKMAQLKTTVTEPGGPVYTDDCVEIYVGPVPRRHCLKLVVNAAGVAATGKRGFDRGKYAEPKPSDVQTAPGRTKTGWTLEISVPLDRLGLKGKAEAGTELGFNVVRFRRPDRFEMSTWIGSINECHSTGTLVLE